MGEWRRGRDSNPRSPSRRTTVFETAPFDRSGTSPRERGQGLSTTAPRTSSERRPARHCPLPRLRPPPASAMLSAQNAGVRDGGECGAARRGDRGRHGRGVRGELAAARRPQRLPGRAGQPRRRRLVRQCRVLQRLIGDPDGDARGAPQRAALADGPARAAGAALELPAGDPALSHSFRALRHAGEGARRRRRPCARWSGRPSRWCATSPAMPGPKI